MYKTTTQQDIKFIKDYTRGLTIREITNKYKVPFKAVYRILTREKIKFRPAHTRPPTASNLVRRQLLRLYKAGVTVRSGLTQQFGLGERFIYQILREGGASITRRWYSVDEHYFDAINTQEKAYWLGFLSADGGIGPGSIHLFLKSSDSSHIAKFKLAIKSEHPVRTHYHQTITKRVVTTTGIVISSIRLTRALFKLGVSRRKSLTIKPCSLIPKQFIQAYWRGILDGDGSICAKPDQRVVGLLGSHAMIKGFVSYIKKCTGLQAKIKPTSKGQISLVRYGSRIAIYTITKLLYENATAYLDRKYAVALQILNDPYWCYRSNSIHHPLRRTGKG